MSYEIVTSVKRCGVIADMILETEPVIALGGEGVNLGTKGPLTLLQIGTNDGQVYLFDIKTERPLLEDGPLKGILESGKVTKIIHNCQWISAALIEQFSITLQGVFDTQVAYKVLGESKRKRQFPHITQEDVVDFCGVNSTDLRSKKYILKQINSGPFCWTERPLTQEMVEYGVAKTTVMFSVYNTPLRDLHKRALCEKYKERVSENKVVLTNGSVREKIYERQHAQTCVVIHEIADKIKENTGLTLNDLNEEEKLALDLSKDRHFSTCSEIIGPVRKDRFMEVMRELSKEIEQNPEQFQVSYTSDTVSKLKEYKDLYKNDEDLRAQTQTLIDQIKSLERNYILRYFRNDTPLGYIDRPYLGYIRSLRIWDEIYPLLIELINRVLFQDWTELNDCYMNDPENFKMNKSVYWKVKSLAGNMHGNLSQPLRQLSAEIWDKFVKKYGSENGY